MTIRLNTTMRAAAAAALLASTLGLAACGGGDLAGDDLVVTGPADQPYCPPDPTVFVGPIQPQCFEGLGGAL